MAISVVKDGRVVFAKGYGARAWQAGAGGLGDALRDRLHDEGDDRGCRRDARRRAKVRWDDPVTRYIPGFQTADPYVTSELTVRDLLTHRGGLGNADYLWYESDVPATEVRRRLRFLRPAYSLRSSFIYQNAMYAVAGDVVEAASGTPWEESSQARNMRRRPHLYLRVTGVERRGGCRRVDG